MYRRDCVWCVFKHDVPSVCVYVDECVFWLFEHPCPSCAFWSPCLSRRCDSYKSMPGGHQGFCCVLFRNPALKKKHVVSGVFLPLYYLTVFLVVVLFVLHSLGVVSVSTVYLVFSRSHILVQSVFFLSCCAVVPGRDLDEDSFRDVKPPVTVKVEPEIWDSSPLRNLWTPICLWVFLLSFGWSNQ